MQNPTAKKKKPLVKLPDIKLGNSLKTMHIKTIEKIEQMLRELTKKEPGPSNTYFKLITVQEQQLFTVYL
jgi:predicted Zn-dependent protease